MTITVDLGSRSGRLEEYLGTKAVRIRTEL